MERWKFEGWKERLQRHSPIASLNEQRLTAAVNGANLLFLPDQPIGLEETLRWTHGTPWIHPIRFQATPKPQKIQHWMEWAAHDWVVRWYAVAALMESQEWHEQRLFNDDEHTALQWSDDDLLGRLRMWNPNPLKTGEGWHKLWRLQPTPRTPGWMESSAEQIQRWKNSWVQPPIFLAKYKMLA